MLNGRTLLTLRLFASNARHLMGAEEEETDKSSRRERQTRRMRGVEGSLIGIEGVASFRAGGLIIFVTPTYDSRFTIKTSLERQKHPNKTAS